MKVLYPIGSLYPSQVGGPCNTVYWMAKGLMAKGIEVTIVTTNAGAENMVTANKWMNTDYGRIIYCSANFPLFPWRMLIFTISTMPSCDVVHLTSVFYPPSLVAALAARWYGKPIFWSPRGELDRLALVYSSWKKKPILGFIRRFLVKKTTFHSTSPEETQRVKEILGSETTVVEIPNFLELPTLQLLTLPYRNNFIYVGRIHPKKAIENLIEALQFSPRFLSMGFNLIIAGDCNNSYGVRLKKQVEKLGLSQKVQFIGHIEGEAKQKLFANAYFSILPSNTENFGNVVVESLAQGTPVIASTGTPWAILEKEHAGIWVDNTPIALAEAIDKALAFSPEKYQDFRINSLSIVQQFFEINENVYRWIDVYLSNIYPVINLKNSQNKKH
jgi:glycosyltransferase involved in cell wall biosynthesis